MKKTSVISYIGLILIVACSNTSNKSNNNLPSPPHNINAIQESIAIPQLNRNTPRSLKNFENQSSNYESFTKIQEIRGFGGNVSEIRINNRGDIPNYYIYPNQQPDLNINNPQRNISTPTWQLNW